MLQKEEKIVEILEKSFKAYIGLNAVSSYHPAITIICRMLEQTIWLQLSLPISKKSTCLLQDLKPGPRPRSIMDTRSRPLSYGP